MIFLLQHNYTYGICKNIPNDIQAHNKLTNISKNSQRNKPSSETHLKEMALCMLMYIQDHNDQFPLHLEDPSAVRTDLLPYAKAQSMSAAIFYQVANAQPFRANSSLNGILDASIPNPHTLIMLYEQLPDKYGGRYVALADGRVRKLSNSEWKQKKITSHI